MKIYEPDVLDGFEWALPVRENDFDLLSKLDGLPRSDTWAPVSMYLLRENDDGSPRQSSDFPWLGEHVLILRQRVVDALGGFFRQYGEILPLECADTDLHLFNASCLVDALDLDRSLITRFPHGPILDIQTHVFRQEVVDDIHIFKIPQTQPRGTLYVSAEFVDRVSKAGLGGLDFRLVWDSEEYVN